MCVISSESLQAANARAAFFGFLQLAFPDRGWLAKEMLGSNGRCLAGVLFGFGLASLFIGFQAGLFCLRFKRSS